MEDDKITELLDRRRKVPLKTEKGQAKHYGLCSTGSEQMVTFKLREGRQHLSLNYGHMLQCYWSRSDDPPQPAEVVSPLAKAVRAVNPFSAPKQTQISLKASEHVKVTFTAGWEVRILGRGLEVIHRALVSRSLSWVRGALANEHDNNEIETFVEELRLVRAQAAESST